MVVINHILWNETLGVFLGVFDKGPDGIGYWSKKHGKEVREQGIKKAPTFETDGEVQVMVSRQFDPKVFPTYQMWDVLPDLEDNYVSERELKRWSIPTWSQEV
jgi:hypothetical protein